MRALLAATLVALVAAAVAASGALAQGDALVTNGSDPTTFSQDKQNEPAVAIDANHPNILAAGANEEIDMEACNAGDDTTVRSPLASASPASTSRSTRGTTWKQPTYTG